MTFRTHSGDHEDALILNSFGCYYYYVCEHAGGHTYKILAVQEEIKVPFRVCGSALYRVTSRGRQQWNSVYPARPSVTMAFPTEQQEKLTQGWGTQLPGSLTASEVLKGRICLEVCLRVSTTSVQPCLSLPLCTHSVGEKEPPELETFRAQVKVLSVVSHIYNSSAREVELWVSLASLR